MSLTTSFRHASVTVRIDQGRELPGLTCVKPKSSMGTFLCGGFGVEFSSPL